MVQLVLSLVNDTMCFGIFSFVSKSAISFIVLKLFSLATSLMFVCVKFGGGWWSFILKGKSNLVTKNC